MYICILCLQREDQFYRLVLWSLIMEEQNIIICLYIRWQKFKMGIERDDLEYSSWRVGRGAPIIPSAVRTVLCSLLMSDVVLTHISMPLIGILFDSVSPLPLNKGNILHYFLHKMIHIVRCMHKGNISLFTESNNIFYFFIIFQLHNSILDLHFWKQWHLVPKGLINNK